MRQWKIHTNSQMTSWTAIGFVQRILTSIGPSARNSFGALLRETSSLVSSPVQRDDMKGTDVTPEQITHADDFLARVDASTQLKNSR